MDGRAAMKRLADDFEGLLPICAALLLALVSGHPGWAGKCEDIANIKLPNTVIKSAQQVGSGEFTAPGRGKQPDFPAFCRVVASVV